MKKYYRKITDLLPKASTKYVNRAYLALHLRNFLFIVLVVLIGVLLQLLVILNGNYEAVRKNYAEREEKYEYWKSVASQFPQIPDILFNASLSAVEFGRKDEAIKYLNRALAIDPLFKTAVDLRTKLQQM